MLTPTTILRSGIVRSGHVGNAAVVSGSIASGAISLFHLASGVLAVGSVGSGTVQGFYGTKQIASGTLGSTDLASGGVEAGALGSGAVRSGNVASGSIGYNHLSSGCVVSGRIASGNVAWSHLASGAVRSGHLAATGTPDGTKFLRDDFSWAIAGSSGGGGLFSGSVQSGNIASGSVQGYWGATRHIAAGTVGVDDFASGAVSSGKIGSAVVTSGNIAPGSVGTSHIVSGATVTKTQFVSPFVTSGTHTILAGELISGVRAVTMNQSGRLVIAMASVSGRMPAIGVVVNNVAEGDQATLYTVGEFIFPIGAAHFSGYLGQPLYVGRSGQIVTTSGSWNSGGLLSGDVIQPIAMPNINGGALINLGIPLPFVASLIYSGQIASGQVGWPHLAASSVRSGHINAGGTPDGTKFLRDDYTWAVPQSGGGGGGSLSSGAVGSGYLASGSVQGYWGGTRHIASGTVGVDDLASGAVVAGAVGSGAVRSGNIASGVVGFNHIASGAVNSGRLGVTGTPDGTKFLRDDFVWATPQSGGGGGGSLTSGAITSGWIIGSGAIIGQAGGGVRMVASGTFSTYDLASGATATRAQFVSPFVSGTAWTAITEEMISGVRAVQISPSGNIRIAMASVSGRNQAMGVVVDNVASGIQANVYTAGVFQFADGLADFSGSIGKPLFLGRSGQLVTVSGSWNSGGLLSGDNWQVVGFPRNSGAAAITFGAMPFVVSLIYSGDIASGQVGNPHIAANSIQSGQVGSGAVMGSVPGGTEAFMIGSGTVSFYNLGSGSVRSGHANFWSIPGHANNNNSGAAIASGSIFWQDISSGALRSGHYAQGQIFHLHLASGAVTSGRLSVTGTPDGTKFLRDDFSWQAAGGASLTSGVITSGWIIGSGAIIGAGAGGVRIVASGTLSTDDLNSGTVVRTARGLMTFRSGVAPYYLTGESISGVRAVSITESGTLRIAMASVSGRMPAIGVVLDNVASGIAVNVHTDGAVQLTSGMADYSGYVGLGLYVGRSGQIVTTSGSWNSGGLLSGDIWQPVAFATGSGSVQLSVAAQLTFLPGQVLSGDIGSGQVSTFHLASGTQVPEIVGWYTCCELISGVRAVAMASGFGGRIVNASKNSGLRMPAIGVTYSGGVSGSLVAVVRKGIVTTGASGMLASGFVTRAMTVGSGGVIQNNSGWMGGTPYASGDLIQLLGQAVSGGIYVDLSPVAYNLSGLPGQFGPNWLFTGD